MDSLPELFDALSKAQLEIKPAVLDCINPHFKSKYASLSSVQDAYKLALSKHGLVVIQQIESVNGSYQIKSTLAHKSGQSVSNVFSLIVERPTMQGLGSAITYGRRYGISALLGIVDTEDDDGNAASVKQKETTPTPTQTVLGNKFVSEDQLKRLFAISKAKGWTHEQCKDYIDGRWGLKSSKELDRQKYNDLVSVIENFNYTEALEQTLILLKH